MTILEKFLILFESDASDVKKGADQAEKSVKQLDDNLKKVGDDSHKVGESFLEMSKALTSVIAGFVSIGAVVGGLKQAASYTIQLGLASRQFGVSAEALDAWGQAVRRNGGTVESFQQSLKSLATHFGTTVPTAMRLLPQLADGFARMNPTRAIYAGNMLGLDPSLVMTLQKGRKEIELLLQREKELGVVTQHNTDVALKFNNQVQDMGHAFRSLFVTLDDTILPVLGKFLETFTNIAINLRQHSSFIIGTFGAMAVAALYFARNALLAWGALIIPIALAVGAIGLLYEDFTVWMENGNSLMGRIFGKWEDRVNQIKKVIDSIKGHLKWFSDYFNGSKTLNQIYQEHREPQQQPLDSYLRNGKLTLQVAGSSQLNALPSNRIFNQGRDLTTNVTTGDIVINTQATDTEGISASFVDTLKKHLWHLNNSFADGVVS